MKKDLETKVSVLPCPSLLDPYTGDTSFTEVFGDSEIIGP